MNKQPFMGGTFGWIQAAVVALKHAAISQGVPGSSLGLSIDILLSGVPCPPKDFGFNSPADQRARRLLEAWEDVPAPQLDRVMDAKHDLHFAAGMLRARGESTTAAQLVEITALIDDLWKKVK